jgi:hypothetical protein
LCIKMRTFCFVSIPICCLLSYFSNEDKYH